MYVIIGLARKNTITPAIQTIKPLWNERLFSSPPKAVNKAMMIIPIENIVIPKVRNSIKMLSSKLFSESNIQYDTSIIVLFA